MAGWRRSIRQEETGALQSAVALRTVSPFVCLSLDGGGNSSLVAWLLCFSDLQANFIY